MNCKIPLLCLGLTLVLSSYESTQNGNEKGEDLYKEHCKSCHQRSGKGFFKMYPPLTDPAWVADDEKIVGNLLNGLKGEINVNGKTFDGEMPAFRYLTNREIALIVNYVRTDIAETGAPISVEEVARLRNELQTDSLKILTK
ncbi:MAG: cytochrome c [Owenweeksia sp.]